MGSFLKKASYLFNFYEIFGLVQLNHELEFKPLIALYAPKKTKGLPAAATNFNQSMSLRPDLDLPILRVKSEVAEFQFEHY